MESNGMGCNKISIVIIVIHCIAFLSLLIVIVVFIHRHCYHCSLSLLSLLIVIVVIVHCYCNPFNVLIIVVTVIVYCYIQYCYCCHNIAIFSSFIVHCHCSSSCIVIAVNCSLCAKHWSLLLLFIVHYYSWSFKLYCVLSLFVVIIIHRCFCLLSIVIAMYFAL